MTRLQEVHELFAYNRWANARVRAAAGVLDEGQFTQNLGNSFPSVRDTLVHMLSAEWIWLSRWEGVSPRAMPDGWQGSSFAQLEQRWASVEARQSAVIGSLTEQDLDRVLEYTNLAGDRMSSTMSQMLRHVVNHATYHRGQITTMLRQLGAVPVSSDLIHYYRTVAPPALPAQ